MTQTAKPRVVPIVLAIVAALLGVGGFVVLLVQASFRTTWRLSDLMHFLNDGGYGSWLVLAMVIIAGLATAGLGFWLTSKKSAWSWTASAPPLLLVLVAWLWEFLGVNKTAAAIAGESVDPAQKFRIMSEGISEATALGILGGLGGCAIMAAIAVVFAARALSRVPGASFRASAIGALLGGVLGISAVVALALVWPAFKNSGFGFGWFPALMTLAASVLAGIALSDRSACDPARAEALGDLLIAAAYSAFSVLLAGAAVHGLGFRMMTGLVSGESVDPSQAPRLAGEAMAIMDGGLSVQLLYLLPVALAFGAAAAPSVRQVPRALKTALLGAAPAVAVGILALVMLLVPRMRREQTLVRMFNRWIPPNMNLTIVKSMDTRPGGTLLIVTPTSVMVESAEVAKTDSLDPASCLQVVSRALASERYYRRVLIVADKDVAYGRVQCILRAMDAKEAQSQFDFLVHVELNRKLSAPWDVLARLTGSVSLGRVVRAVPRGGPLALDRVHLHKDAWEVHLGGKQGTISGSVQDRFRVLSANVAQVAVTADPDVPISDVLLLAANSRTLGASLDIDKP